MKQPSKKSSSEKEDRKINSKKSNFNKVREDKNNSIYAEANNKNNYPYEQVPDKQFDNQPEFIDRNSDTKDKS